MPNDHQSPPSLPGPSDIPVVQFDVVLREELQLISNRRQVLFPHIVNRDGSPITEIHSPASSPDAKNDPDDEVTRQRGHALDKHLAGLAFSGGGIRSASFAIGVLQGLASLKLLNWFDYLSTVSGGGYAGGWLVAWLSREGNPINVEQQLDVNRIQQAKASRHYAENPSANPPAWKPLTQDHTADKIAKRGLILDEEPEPVVYLRAYSSYLTPRGGLFSADTWAMLAIYLRNVCINLLILLPLLFALTLSIRYIIELFVWSLEACVQVERSLGELGLFALFVLGLLLGFLGLACNARAVWGLRSVPRSFELDNRKLSRGGMALGNPLSRLQQAFARLLARFHKKFLTFRSALVGARFDAPGAVAYSVVCNCPEHRCYQVFPVRWRRPSQRLLECRHRLKSPLEAYQSRLFVMRLGRLGCHSSYQVVS